MDDLRFAEAVFDAVHGRECSDCGASECGEVCVCEPPCCGCLRHREPVEAGAGRCVVCGRHADGTHEAAGDLCRACAGDPVWRAELEREEAAR